MGQLASLSDEALLQSAIGGVEEAWTELVGRYHPKGMQYLRRQIDDPYLAQDIMQNLWVALVRTVKREFPERFAAIFWTLLKRRLIDELRRKGRNKEHLLLNAPAGSDESGSSLIEIQRWEGPDPVDESIRSDETQLLYRALEQLPDHYRLVLQARQFEGLSNRETARLLLAEGLVTDDGNVEKRVENYYYRGLKELKRQLLALGDYGGGSGA